jgi:hypothetical protein
MLLTGLAVLVGLGLSFVVVYAFGLFLPPFQPEDDDTIRDYGPVLVSYAAWGLTSVVGSVWAWRWLRSRVIHRR